MRIEDKTFSPGIEGTRAINAPTVADLIQNGIKMPLDGVRQIYGPSAAREYDSMARSAGFYTADARRRR